MFLAKSHVDDIMKSMENNLNNNIPFDLEVYQNRKNAALQYLNLSSQILEDLDFTKEAATLTHLMLKVSELEFEDKNDIFLKNSDEDNSESNHSENEIQIEEEVDEDDFSWLID